MRTARWTGLTFSLALAATSVAHADAETRYPIFLAEGFGGLDYFLVREALEAEGATVCNPPDDQVPHFAGSEARADILIQQIQACTAAHGVGQVNLIGYSQGGEDARVVLKKRPDLLASVTTVGTAHRESSGLADRFIVCAAKQQLGAVCTADEQAAFTAFVGLGAVGSDPDAPNPPSSLGVLQAQRQFSSGTNLLALAVCLAQGFDVGPTFDLKYPAGLPLTSCGEGFPFTLGPALRKIPLFSWGGTQVQTNPADPSDAALQVTSAFQKPGNDGLVERCSTHFGKVVRDDYPLNHLDLINQRGGLTGTVDPVALFTQHAARLKALGL